MFKPDNRIVLTLDAGGTNFVFSAIQNYEEIVSPIFKSTIPDNLDKCLHTLVEGFTEVLSQLNTQPVAISFAFPGPADYKNGIIGDLPNFPSFRGGVPLGAYLEKRFNLPVFINNDGNLFAYGEAMAGILPQVNNDLEKRGSKKRYQNLLGITLGTGFGGGVVINNNLLLGDNGCGGDVWNFRNKHHSDKIAEESVSIRAVQRVYKELSKDDATLTPKEIFDIAEGTRKGDREAAKQSFAKLGEATADAIAHALGITDGLVVIGGGLTGAAKYIMPTLIKELKSELSTFSGMSFARLQTDIYDLTDKKEYNSFLIDRNSHIKVPEFDVMVPYDYHKSTGVAISKMGTSKAIFCGAYGYALNELDK